MNNGMSLGREAGVQMQFGVRLWMPYAAVSLGFTMFLLRLIADLVAVLLKIVPPFGLDDN